MSVVHKSKALSHIVPPDTLRLVYKTNTLMYMAERSHHGLRHTRYTAICS
jgi:hypothetical protein